MLVPRSWRHASCSTAGRRAINEDRAATLRLSRAAYVVAVADGMGGTAAGDVASGVAMTAFLTTVRTSATENPRLALRTAFAAADTAVRNAIVAGREGMGTTLTAAIIRGPNVWVGNIGDSRAVLIMRDEVLALSREHSLVAEALRRGEMTELQALQSSERHVISRALGEGDALPDIKYFSLSGRGDPLRATLVAGSDGLFNFVGETEMLEIACDKRGAGEVVEQLVRRAIENGSDDNVSAAAVRLDASLDRPRGFVRAAVTLVVIFALSAAAYQMRHQIARGARVIAAFAGSDTSEVKVVRLPHGARPLRTGANGRLCDAKGDCFGTWRVVGVDAAAAFIEIRTTETTAVRAGGDR